MTQAHAPERRIVANPHFRWMKDMLVVCPPRHDGGTGYFVRLERSEFDAGPFDHPEPNDHGTLGCVLQLVREAWKDDSIELEPITLGAPGQHAFSHRHFISRGHGKTEFAALVEALEAAPVRDGK